MCPINKLIISVLALLHIYSLVCAQQPELPQGAQSWMVGGACAATTSVFGIANNPAAMPVSDRWQATAGHAQPFLESKLQHSFMFVQAPFKKVQIGAGFCYNGFSLFNQQRWVLSISKVLTPKWHLGVQANYHVVSIEGYGNTYALLPALGTWYMPVKELQIGFVLVNPLLANYSGQSNEATATYARLGIVYALSDKLKVIADAQPSLNNKATYCGGLFYQLHNKVQLSIGARSFPLSYTFGTRLVSRNIAIDIASVIHPVLGVTPHIALTIPAGL